MPGALGRRTRIVRWLRVILPLVALAILSVLFLLGRSPDPEARIPYAEGRIEDLARSPGITAPEYSTVTPDGATVTVTAARADPSGSDGRAQQVALDWRARDGVEARVTAAEAAQEGPAITLSGDVDMALSSGWRLTAPRIAADTDASRVVADEGVAVTAPFGELTAGGMVYAADPQGRQVLELNRGVRLLYRP